MIRTKSICDGWMEMIPLNYVVSPLLESLRSEIRVFAPNENLGLNMFQTLGSLALLTTRTPTKKTSSSAPLRAKRGPSKFSQPTTTRLKAHLQTNEPSSCSSDASMPLSTRARFPVRKEFVLQIRTTTTTDIDNNFCQIKENFILIYISVWCTRSSTFMSFYLTAQCYLFVSVN